MGTTVKDRIRQLYSFLREANQLRFRPVRLVADHPRVVHLDDMPRHESMPTAATTAGRASAMTTKRTRSIRRGLLSLPKHTSRAKKLRRSPRRSMRHRPNRIPPVTGPEAGPEFVQDKDQDNSSGVEAGADSNNNRKNDPGRVGPLVIIAVPYARFVRS